MERNIDQMNKTSEDFEHYPKLSIIVPVYRVENYLKRCIESILNQSFQNFELILVDDGSPDRCGEIIDQFHQIDKRVVAIHQTNQGVSSARNAGLQIARGEYVGFVDPDDYIEPEMYNILIRILEDNNADISCCSWNDIHQDGTRILKRNYGVSELMEHSEFMNHIFDMPYSILGSVCNKLFKKELIRFEFQYGCRMGEDTIFTVQYACLVQRAAYREEGLYNIYHRPDSAMRLHPENRGEGIFAWKTVMDIVKDENAKTKYLAEKMYLDKCLLFSKQSGRFGNVANVLLHNYLRENMQSVLMNSEIYWKTKLVYMMQLLRDKG